MPMCGRTGPEYLAQVAAAFRSCRRTTFGSLLSDGFSSAAVEPSSVPAPQLTGEDWPTPRGSKVTTS